MHDLNHTLNCKLIKSFRYHLTLKPLKISQLHLENVSTVISWQQSLVLLQRKPLLNRLTYIRCILYT